MEIMLQPREIYNRQQELDNFHGNWIIASGNFPFAVEKMIFPVGNELFPMRNYDFLCGNYVLLAAMKFFSLEIILRSFAKILRSMAMNFFFMREEPPLTEIIKFPWKLAMHLAGKRLVPVVIESFPLHL